MKVGDLITLSAHGQTMVSCNHRKKQVGVVVKTIPVASFSGSHPDENLYEIRWADRSKPFDSFNYHRRDLKFATKRNTRNNASRGSCYGCGLIFGHCCCH